MLIVCHCRSISLQYCIKQKVVRNLLNGYFLNNIYFLYFLYFSNNIFLMKGFVCLFSVFKFENLFSSVLGVRDYVISKLFYSEMIIILFSICV